MRYIDLTGVIENGMWEYGEPYPKVKITQVSSDVGGAIFFRWNPSAPQQYIDLNTLKGTSDWKLITKKITVPSSAQTVNLYIEMYKGKGTIWIDTIEFEQI